jgi:hypothetical protein
MEREGRSHSLVAEPSNTRGAAASQRRSRYRIWGSLRSGGSILANAGFRVPVLVAKAKRGPDLFQVGSAVPFAQKSIRFQAVDVLWVSTGFFV